MRTKLSTLAFLVLIAVGAASADTYQVTVNTSSISGEAGSIDLQFNPGSLVTEAATAQIAGFTSDGALVSASPNNAVIGDVSGTLPGSLSISNADADNEYFEDFDFGSTLSFDVTINGTTGGTSGSVFAFSLFSDPQGTQPVLTADPNGIVFTEDFNTDGTTTATNASPEAVSSLVVPVSATPEPGTGVLWAIAIALAGSGLFFRAKWRASAAA